MSTSCYIRFSERSSASQELTQEGGRHVPWAEWLLGPGDQPWARTLRGTRSLTRRRMRVGTDPAIVLF